MRAILVVVLLAGVAVVAYNYGAGRGLTFQVPGLAGRVDEDLARGVRSADSDTVRERGTALVERAAEHASTAANRTEHAVADGTLTAKIKAKMALDDVVKAANINVDSNGSVVTLTGDVASREEQQRALRLAKETAGVTTVFDRLRVAR